MNLSKICIPANYYVKCSLKLIDCNAIGLVPFTVSLFTVLRIRLKRYQWQLRLPNAFYNFSGLQLICICHNSRIGFSEFFFEFFDFCCKSFIFLFQFQNSFVFNTVHLKFLPLNLSKHFHIIVITDIIHTVAQFLAQN